MTNPGYTVTDVAVRHTHTHQSSVLFCHHRHWIPGCCLPCRLHTVASASQQLVTRLPLLLSSYLYREPEIDRQTAAGKLVACMLAAAAFTLACSGETAPWIDAGTSDPALTQGQLSILKAVFPATNPLPTSCLSARLG